MYGNLKKDGFSGMDPYWTSLWIPFTQRNFPQVHWVPLTTSKQMQKKSVLCSQVLVVTELVVSVTQCNGFIALSDFEIFFLLGVNMHL